MRVQSIDYLRGIMALSVVFYHFASLFNRWGVQDSGTVLGRLGIYAVSAFYVISGMALYLAHKNSEWDAKYTVLFISKRFLRIAPVYWLALILLSFLSYQYGAGVTASAWIYAQNIFLTFGITNPSGYMVMGGWSIGNEIVFYLFFPVMILMAKKPLTFIILVVANFVLFFYCTYYYLDPAKGFGWQWVDYISPINQVYFFIFGIVAARLLLPYVGRRKVLCILAIAALAVIFTFNDAGGDLINITTGSEKIYFTSCIVMLCSAFFLIGDLAEIKPLHTILKFLGDISYPLYLLHGTTLIFMKKIFVTNSTPTSSVVLYGAVTISLLVVASWLTHIFIEQPVIRFSKRLSLPGREHHPVRTGTTSR